MASSVNSTIEKAKGFFKSRRGEFTLLAVLSTLALLFTIILYSVRLSDYIADGTNRGDLNLWTAKLFNLKNSLMPGVTHFYGLNTVFIIAFVGGLALYAIAFIVWLIKKRKVVFYATSFYAMLLDLAIIITGVVLGILRGGAIVCGIISIAFSILLFIYVKITDAKVLADNARGQAVAAGEAAPASPLTFSERKKFGLGVFICECVALALIFTTFLIPLYSEKGASGSSNMPITALASSASVSVTIIFIVIFIAFFAEIMYFCFNVASYFKADKTFIKRSKSFIISAGVFTLLYFVAGFCLAFAFNVIDNAKSGNKFYTVSYIPLIIFSVLLIVYAIFFGKMRDDGQSAAARVRKWNKIEPLVAVIVLTAITFLSLLLNVVEIRVVVVDKVIREVALNGYKLLADYRSLEGGFQVLAFMETTILLLSGVLLVFSAICYFTKSKQFYKIVKTSAVANFFFVLLMGLFGLYFQIAQKVNVENIKSILEYYQITVPSDAYSYKVTSQTVYMLIASFVVIAIMIVRGIFGLGANLADQSADSTAAPAAAEVDATSSSIKQTAFGDFDSCPAFTDLDARQASYQAELEERRRHLFINPSLPNIVRFAVDYARECRLHLSYSAEDMATFVAGLGASRLAILQGMSGTGKTSLPKIFTEALMGNCEIVEVESSWRDKNELLGYYNEFSKCFTPKKFTQCLYRARLNSSALTFIVLDEMNLSRIEYYFSDFLSLMENEENKREIKLSNVKLFRYINGKAMEYDGLIDGHTIKIPSNVWFIGTANRDESTFGISDKVYDRAQTMNFNKRAPKIYSFGDPLEQRFVPYEMLVKLFDKAKIDYDFDAENNSAIKKTEKLLAPYNISFGNRILKQMEDFVKIYCACFGDKASAEKEAVERILLTKVVSKLENKIVESKEALALEFDKIGLKNCGAFVRKLSED